MQNKDERTPPLDPKAGSPSQNSRLHAATKIQSSVTPEDYPEDERRTQVEGAKGPVKGEGL